MAVQAQLQIRPAAPGDAPALAELVGELGYPASAEEMETRLAAFGARPWASALVAVDDGRVVGLLTLEIRILLHRPGPLGRISSMVVAADRRGRNIGRTLVKAAEAVCAEAGCVAVEVTSNRARTGAHAFYERLGYAVTSLRFARTLDD